MSDTALCWFRRDLRLGDNRALSAAAEADALLPVYVIDPRQYGEREFGGSDSFRYEKTGPYRTRFRAEALEDLRDRLRDRGSDLLVRVGEPEEVLPDLAAAVDADRIYHHTRPTAEEERVANAVAGAVREEGLAVRSFWGHTLYHPNDLPNPIPEISDTFTSFRKAVEAEARVRDPEHVPAPFPSLPDPAADADPTALDTEPISFERFPVAFDRPAVDDRAVLSFTGGEEAGKQWLDEWAWDRDNLRTYKETRNGLLGSDYSSKLSPWLNEGCLSPRSVHAEVEHYEDQTVENDSTYWLKFELRWRDFFAFQFAKHRSAFWTKGGIRERDDIQWRRDARDFERWKRGRTGVPFVDANMRELNETGYMSNRGRQIVASFLANNLRIDWRRGAAYFETQLVDYDPCSNYGNWAYIAGVGNDSRDRYFNVIKQAHSYDGDAEYVKHWLPELDALPPKFAHEPWKLDAKQQGEYGVTLGADYPMPMLDLEASYEKLR
jgi:deoxyribodipyrimidine photo-lyase